jgi:flagellar protein FliO/FliZ
MFRPFLLLILAALPLPAPAAAEPSLGGSLVQVLFGLLMIIGLIGAAAWLLRRLGPMPGSANGALRVLGGLSMGARERVVLIQVGQTQLLLGVAPGRVQALHVLETPVVPAPAAGPAGGFAERLAQVIKGGRPG